MGSISMQENQITGEEPNNEVKIAESLIEKFEFLSVNQALQNTPKFSESQVDNLIVGMQENDKRIHDYHTSKLEKEHEINKKKHNLIILIFIAYLVSTLIILLFKDAYFDKWLTFTIGLIGGTGISKWLGNNSKTNQE